MDEIKAGWLVNPELNRLIQSLQVHPQKHFTWFSDQLRRKGKLVIGRDATFRNKILPIWHSIPTGGHSCIDATTRKVLT